MNCPSCRKTVTIADELVGTIVSCPHCAKHFTVPAEGAQAIPIATPAPSPSRMHPLTMVRFTFTCQRCDSVLEARSNLCGQPGCCPTCGALFTVPNVDPRTGLATGPAMVADDGQLPTPMHAYATAGGKAPTIRRLDTGEQVVVCPRCRRDMPVDANVCSACGIPFTMEGASSIGRAGPVSNSLATAALTVAILGVLSCPCQPVIGLVGAGLGIAALMRTERPKSSDSGRNMSIAAIILGAVAAGAFFVLHWVL
ncbi:MAG: DUF4190 domain-containing protein [Phycisphaerae bacterium]|nr:DUF4190 domain-containing protein [Phycisphaerae bacterium]